MYSLKFLPKAKKDLSKIDPIWQKRIRKKLEFLAQNPLSLKNSIIPQRAKDFKGMARLRVGNYRVIFKKDGKELIIVIVRIADRKEIYKDKT